MLCDIDARRLAVVLAHLAVLALVRVDDRAEHRKAGKEAQRRAHRTYRVAIGAPVLPGQDNHRDQRDDGHDEGRQAPQPDFLIIESIAIGPLRQGSEQVVDPDVNRLEQVLDDAAPRAVRRQKGNERLHTRDERDDEQNPDPVAQPLQLGAVAVRLAVFLLAFACHVQVRHSVLENAQRADDGAIDPAEDQGQQDKADDDGDIDGQHGRQKLQLCHPAEPSVQRPGEIQEQQRDAQPEYHGQCDANLFKHGDLLLVVLDKDNKKCLIQYGQNTGRM